MEWEAPFKTLMADQPPEIQDTYNYNPDKAMDLFEEAGIDPATLKLTANVRSFPREIDTMALIADQWAKVGIELTLIPEDDTTHSATKQDRLHEHIWFGYENAATASMGLHSDFLTGAYQNYAVFDNAEYNSMLREYDTTVDEERQVELLRDLNDLLLREVATISTPGYNYFRYAWPWVKNYAGETHTRYWCGQEILEVCWIDEEMKKEMGY